MKSIQECHPKNLHFKVTREYDTEKLWLSDRFNIENFHPIRFYIRLEYTDNWPKEMDVGKYSVTLGVVSPEAMGEEGWQHAKESVGMETLQTKDGFSAAEVCIDYGTAAPFKQWNGNNLKKVLKLAHKELNIVCMLFGFYMDKPINRIGTTGWEWVAGDLNAPIRRLQENVK